MIKYVPIIMLPYIIIDSNEKIMENKKLNFRYIGKMLLYALEFAVVFIGVSTVVTGDFSRILTVLAQTKVYANSIYVQMLLMKIDWDIITKSALIGKAIFCIVYAILIIRTLIKREKDAKYYMWLMIIFLALAITNFRTWYIMWLFGIITELKKEDMIKVAALSLIGEFSNYIIYYFGESWMFGGMYCITVIVAFTIFILINHWGRALLAPTKRSGEI